MINRSTLGASTRRPASPHSSRAANPDCWNASTGRGYLRGVGVARAGRGNDIGVWPSTAGELEALQRELAVEWRGEARWQMPMKVSELRVGGVFVASERREPDPGPGAAGDMAWAAAAVVVDGQLVDGVAMEARFDATYVPGLLAAREGRSEEHTF